MKKGMMDKKKNKGMMDKKKNKGAKNSTVYTPSDVCLRIKSIMEEAGYTPKKVLDLAIGSGNLSRPFSANVFGIDVEKVDNGANTFIQGKLEELTKEDIQKIKGFNPDLVISNPPFNGAPGKKLYPELFIDFVHSQLGLNTPFIMICPMGVRLNQRRTSKRWRKLKNSLPITSILSLPIDTFDGVLFHVEVLFFNLPKLKPHYYLEE